MGMLLRRHRISKVKKVDLTELTVKELKEKAKEKHIENYSKLTKEELIEAIRNVS